MSCSLTRTLQDISIFHPINFIKWNFFWYCPSSKDLGLNCQVFIILESSLKSSPSSQVIISFITWSILNSFRITTQKNILTSLHSIFIDFNILNQLSLGLLQALYYFPYVNHIWIISPSLYLICHPHINSDTCTAPTQNMSHTFNFDVIAQLPLSFINLTFLDYFGTNSKIPWSYDQIKKSFMRC